MDVVDNMVGKGPACLNDLYGEVMEIGIEWSESWL